MRRLSLGTSAQQRAWLVQRLQPYRVESLEGSSEGLLTSYYEPVLSASRLPTAGFAAPLYQPPATLANRKPWYSRQEMDTVPEARQALQGRAIAYLADPVDALVLQIQGSGRLRLTEADGSQKTVRLAYAATNDQPYKSVGRWLLDKGLITDASWPGIKAWISANPQRIQELLWSNPRVVFFKEEALPETDPSPGPKGAQGVALTAGRSIAVDAGSIPYGAPVWLASSGPHRATPAPGNCAGHRLRHCGRRACGLLCWQRRAGGRAGRAAQATPAFMGVVAQTLMWPMGTVAT